jgi:hypothetical protein
LSIHKCGRVKVSVNKEKKKVRDEKEKENAICMKAGSIEIPPNSEPQK